MTESDKKPNNFADDLSKLDPVSRAAAIAAQMAAKRGLSSMPPNLTPEERQLYIQQQQQVMTQQAIHMQEQMISGGGTNLVKGSFRRNVTKKEGEFSQDIEINDVKNRYMLTRGETQSRIKEETGADVTTRGKYYPDRNLATERDPPLYLYISAPNQESLDKAVAKVQEIIDMEIQTISDVGRQNKRFCSGKVVLDEAIATTHGIRHKIVGPGGQYVKHIQSVTNTRVIIKGHGSGYVENATGEEADEPMFIFISGNTEEDVDEARKLCEDLLESIRSEVELMALKNQPPPMINPGYNHLVYTLPPELNKLLYKQFMKVLPANNHVSPPMASPYKPAPPPLPGSDAQTTPHAMGPPPGLPHAHYGQPPAPSQQHPPGHAPSTAGAAAQGPGLPFVHPDRMKQHAVQDSRFKPY